MCNEHKLMTVQTQLSRTPILMNMYSIIYGHNWHTKLETNAQIY